MRPWPSVMLAAGLALSGLCASTSAADDSVPKLGKPLWQVDLRKQDGSKDWLGASMYTAPRQITFVSQGEIVVVRQSDLFSEAMQAHAYSLDVSSGRIIGQAEWTSRGNGWVFGTSDGRCVVNTRDGAALYSAGLKNIVARSSRSIRWAAPDGHVLAVWYGQEEPKHGVTEFLDSKTLEPLGIRFFDKSPDSIGGEFIGYRGSDHSGPLSVIEGPKGVAGKLQTSCDASVDFVRDDVFVASGCETLHVARTDGQLLFSAASSSDEFSSKASRDGRRFVVCRGSFSMSHWYPLRAETFTVFDVAAGKAIARVKVAAAPKGRDDSHAGAALSPDGTLLAILSGGEVRVYRLP
jgi:hypothetical protein